MTSAGSWEERKSISGAKLANSPQPKQHRFYFCVPAGTKEYYIDTDVFFAADCVGALGVIQWVGHFGDWYWRILVRPEGASDLLQVAEPLNYTHYFFTFCRVSTFSRAKSPIIFQSPKIILM